MEWIEFLNTEVDDLVLDRYDAQKTSIKCPDCGRPIYMNKKALILSSPPNYKYWCVCGWNAYVPLYWEKKTPKMETRDCDRCKHYVDYGNGRGCSKWQCEFEVKE